MSWARHTTRIAASSPGIAGAPSSCSRPVRAIRPGKAQFRCNELLAAALRTRCTWPRCRLIDHPAVRRPHLATEVYDVPAASPGDQRRNAERHDPAVYPVHHAGVRYMPVADVVGADTGTYPVGTLVRHGDLDERRLRCPVPDEAVSGNHVLLELCDEPAMPVGGRIGDGLHLLIRH